MMLSEGDLAILFCSIEKKTSLSFMDLTISTVGGFDFWVLLHLTCFTFVYSNTKNGTFLIRNPFLEIFSFVLHLFYREPYFYFLHYMEVSSKLCDFSRKCWTLINIFRSC